jgi:hypothetical protein
MTSLLTANVSADQSPALLAPPARPLRKGPRFQLPPAPERATPQVARAPATTADTDAAKRKTDGPDPMGQPQPDAEPTLQLTTPSAASGPTDGPQPGPADTGGALAQLAGAQAGAGQEPAGGSGAGPTPPAAVQDAQGPSQQAAKADALRAAASKPERNRLSTDRTDFAGRNESATGAAAALPTAALATPTSAARAASHRPGNLPQPEATPAPRPAASRPAQQGAQRTGGQSAEGRAQLPPFRMETPGADARPRGADATARAQASRPLPAEPMGPADVIISSGRRDALAVTIAAASTDLRDRLLSAAGDLRQDLALLGTEVDSIRVELRADIPAQSPASGQQGQDQMGRDQTAQGNGSAETDARDGWNQLQGPDQMWADGTGVPASGIRDPLAFDQPGAEPADEGGANASSDATTDSASLLSDQPGGGHSGGTAGNDERLRFTLSLGAAAPPRPSTADQSAGLETGLPSRTRIDRYA